MGPNGLRPLALRALPSFGSNFRGAKMVTDEQLEHIMALKDSFIDNQPRWAIRG